MKNIRNWSSHTRRLKLKQKHLNIGDVPFISKQNITDNALTTTAKTIVGAINELNDLLTNGTIDCGAF